MSATRAVPRIKESYQSQVVPRLMKEKGYPSVMAVPRLTKVVVNMGIGVADMAKSEDFYTRVLGMQVQQRIDLPHLKEVVVGYEGRTSVVLMHWLG